MSIQISAFKQTDVIRQLRLAYLCPAAKRRIDEFIQSLPNKYAQTEFTAMFEEHLPEDFSVNHVDKLIEIYMRLAVPMLKLADEEYAADLVIPWYLDVTQTLSVGMCSELAIRPNEMIGAISEDVLLCSYNEDDIREMWNNGTLNERVDGGRTNRSPSYPYLRGFMPKDGNVENLLTFVIKQFNYWPVKWDHRGMDLSTNLTQAEQAKLAAFDEVAYIKSQPRTSLHEKLKELRKERKKSFYLPLRGIQDGQN